MSIFADTRRALARWIAPGVGSERQTEAVGAVGANIDADDHLYRRLTQSRRDLPEVTQTRMQDLASYLWQSNLLARQLIEMPIAFLLARGVRVSVADDGAQARIDAWWSDPITDVPLRLPEWMRGMRIFGEQCWPAFVDASSGHVRLGQIDPGAIEEVITDPENPACPIGVRTRTATGNGTPRDRRVIYLGPETMFSTEAQALRAAMPDGECFYFRKNVLGGGRGRSDLLAAVDWLDAYERFMFGEIDRADFLRSFVWDVTLTGAKPDEVVEKAKEISAPEPGGVRVHNENEIWKAETPDIKSYDSAGAARLWRNHLLGGLAIPEHWFGGGGDVNRAVGAEMGEPTFKMIGMEQNFWSEILCRIASFVVWRASDPAGVRPPDPSLPDPNRKPRADWPELVDRDVTKHSSALQQSAAAGAVAIDRGLLSEETVTRILASIAGRLGVEIDAAEELERAREEASERAEADTFPGPPGDDGD